MGIRVVPRTTDDVGREPVPAILDRPDLVTILTVQPAANAIPAVVDAEPGIVTDTDLPLPLPRGDVPR